MCEIEFQRMLINILSFILRSHKIIRYLRKEKKADGLCFQYERTTSDSDLLGTLYITTCLVCMHKPKGEFSFRGCWVGGGRGAELTFPEKFYFIKLRT